MSTLARRSPRRAPPPSRAAWFALGSVGTLGSLWLLAMLWRRAWGISSPSFASPEPAPAPTNTTTTE